MITNKQRGLLTEYDINPDEFTSITELLIKINSVMVDFIDEDDEPLDEFLELERVYDQIYAQN